MRKFLSVTFLAFLFSSAASAASSGGVTGIGKTLTLKTSENVIQGIYAGQAGSADCIEVSPEALQSIKDMVAVNGLDFTVGEKTEAVIRLTDAQQREIIVFTK